MTTAPHLSAVPSPPRASRVSISTVTASRGGPKPLRIVLHGAPKVGKSTFASDAPAPIFVSIDDGLGELDAQRFPIPHSFGDVLGAVQALTLDPHDYQTVVIDHASILEPLIWDLVCRENGWLSIETPSYQKGYHAAVDRWRDLLASLDRLMAKRSMHAIVVVQSLDVIVKPKDRPEHAQAMLALNRFAAGLLRQWSDCTLYAGTETDAAGDTRHVLRTTPSDSWHAGNRFSLPPTMVLDARPFWREIAAAQVPVEELVARARRLAAELGGDAPAEVETALRKGGRHPWELLAICRRVQTEIDAFYLENSR